mmetsp:Transcript_4156/g.4616  ORF Transcript_4156/g.4616 Transcript_4156/m.4616 type:complete len:81 (+) Transcript_4156:37-279(+)
MVCISCYFVPLMMLSYIIQPIINYILTKLGYRTCKVASPGSKACPVSGKVGTEKSDCPVKETTQKSTLTSTDDNLSKKDR